MSLRDTSGRKRDVITSDDPLGKDVVDPEGRFIGVVEKVLIDPKTLDLMGIDIDKGFFKKGHSLGKSYVSHVTPYAVFLSVQVAYELKGKLVFDKDGRELGAVVDVTLIGGKNNVREIIVKRGFFGKKITIPHEYIKMKGENVILNLTEEKIVSLQQEVTKSP